MPMQLKESMDENGEDTDPYADDDEEGGGQAEEDQEE
jgi:hypothetical protein